MEMALFLKAVPAAQSPAEAEMRKPFKRVGRNVDYFEHDNAYFRRYGTRGAVDDVLNEKTGEWQPYTGDRSKVAHFGDQCGDPLAGNDVPHEAATQQNAMAKPEPPCALFTNKPKNGVAALPESRNAGAEVG